MTSQSKALPNRLNVREQVVCPSCWKRFPPDEIRWVASNPSLTGDPIVGDEFPLRFLPTRFDLAGDAIDSAGSVCSELACPQCHLTFPRPLLEMPASFFSIAGTPACGKSYFLASMTWQLRSSLPRYFSIGISDADPQCNEILNSYEEQQFFNANSDAVVRLRKTEEQGDHYAAVRQGDQTVLYPRPFLFSIRPLPGHPKEDESQEYSRVLCMYDNAGESYLPGKDDVANPVTRHLAKAASIFYCYDPTQDPRFRAACQGKTNDPQVVLGAVTARQETVLHELSLRFRKLTGLGQAERTDRPLVVIVTKVDAWRSLIPEVDLAQPFVKTQTKLHAIDLRVVDRVSESVRDVLFEHSPELVAAAEAFSENVLYVPVSATGRAPSQDPETKVVGVKPSQIAPVWCDVPLIAAIARWGKGLIPSITQDSFPTPAGDA